MISILLDLNFYGSVSAGVILLSLVGDYDWSDVITLLVNRNTEYVYLMSTT